LEADSAAIPRPQGMSTLKGSDGDTTPDGADDQDHDGRSNLEEITAGGDGLFTGPQEPCDPDPEAPICERHTR
jgi:hypothetical protein